ncbi:C-type lectin domain family 12 member B-like [Xyrauchen texanus]|uniref:C-type lectin domain family 12 member B-like n=1 Tax=Xyrauchen texanus TaxID=154827 RepID=UPI00224241B4|nr:C-type lectin domain family 12 member B-like [Xyrauchen texanus]
MSEVIYDNVIRTDILELDRGERMEIMVNIYDSADLVRNRELWTNSEDNSTERQQPQPHAGSVSLNRKQKEVCLWLLCVLLLAAVIVISVTVITERNQLKTNNDNLTRERELLFKKNKYLIEEKDTFLMKNRTLSEEMEQLLTKLNELQTQNRILSEERDRFKIKSDELQGGLREQDLRSDNFKWIYYNFSFYYFSSEYKSWRKSRRDCIDRGADLVTINSPEEQDFLRKVAATNYFWIGLTKTEGVWKWADGTKLTNGYWRNKYHYYYCTKMTATWWDNYSCDSNLRWICEKGIYKQITPLYRHANILLEVRSSLEQMEKLQHKIFEEI